MGAGTRIAGGWELSGLTLPASGQIRARARTVGGFHCSSTGLVQSVAAFGGPAEPEIAVELPLGTDLPNGDGRSFAPVLPGTSTSLDFTITNTGAANLTGILLTKYGTDASQFNITTSPATTVAGPNDTSTFTVQFAPTTGGDKFATLHLASNDADEAPFDIALFGHAISTTDDSDGDGLNDAAEFKMAALGFDWQLNQTDMVTTLFNNISSAPSNLNAAGFYSQAQVQSLNVGTPLLQKNLSTGAFTLTIGVEKSTTLAPQSFNPLPMSAPQTIINADGKLEFQFTVPDNAAFFRLQSQ